MSLLSAGFISLDSTFNRHNLTWGWGEVVPTCMRKGYRAHIQRKFVIQDDAVMASTGLPPDLEARGLEV
jgi:hypothetical protein